MSLFDTSVAYNSASTIRMMQAAVVGVTCRLDAIELMEKRVRSRFSHEKELVLNPQPDSTVAQDSPAGVLQALLQLPPDVGVALPYVLRSNAAVAEALEQPGVQAALQSLVLKGDVHVSVACYKNMVPALCHQRAFMRMCSTWISVLRHSDGPSGLSAALRQALCQALMHCMQAEVEDPSGWCMSLYQLHMT